MAVQEQTLENLLILNNIFVGDDVIGKKNVFSTNVFIPENIENIDIKTYNYFTGFIKLTETFKHRTDDSWILIIYIDKMFVDKRTYNNINTGPSINNTEYNTTIKTRFTDAGTEFKKKINVLLSLYKQYIKHIKENPDNYKRIKLISYECKHLNNYKYLGHTSTFGSIIRFLPLFETNLYEHIVFINISHAISVFFFCEINKWIKDKDTLIMTIGSKYGELDTYQDNLFNILSGDNIIEQYDFDYDEHIYYKFSYNNYRLLAGLCGIKKQNLQRHDTEQKGPGSYHGKHIDRCTLFTSQMYSLVDLFKKYINNIIKINPFYYGCDEIIITDIFFDILSNNNENPVTYKKSNNKLLYLCGREYDYDKNEIYKKLEIKIKMLKILKDKLSDINKTNNQLFNKLITMENFKELENNEYNLLIDLNKDRIKLNNKITTNVETNIKNRYQTYMNDKSNSVIKEEFCRYIDVNTFITETTIMDELNSVYSDYILFTLLNSLDEKTPILVVPHDMLKQDSQYSEINIISDTKLSSQFHRIIEHYKNLHINQLTFKIKDKVIDPTIWNTEYINILLQYTPGDNKIHDSMLTEYIKKNNIKKKCEIAQISINNINKLNESSYSSYIVKPATTQKKSTRITYTDLLEFDFLQFDEHYTGGGYNKKITKTINGKRKHINKKTQKKHIKNNKKTHKIQQI